MEAAITLVHDDAVHFPPLSTGERVKCTYHEPTGTLKLGAAYTVLDNPRTQPNGPDQITLMEVPGAFSETLFDRLK